MKIVIVSLFASLLMSHALSAQQQSKDTPPPQYIQASGATVTFQNAPGSGTITLEYLFTTGISAPTITVQGCGAGGTCTTLTAITGTNPYTTATNAMVTFAGGYFQYKVTATYTGTGTATVSFVGIQAKAGSTGGGATLTPNAIQYATSTTATRAATGTDVAALLGPVKFVSQSGCATPVTSVQGGVSAVGYADSAACIQGLLNTSGVKTVVVDGNYGLSTTLLIPSGVALVGQGLNTGLIMLPNSNAATIINAAQVTPANCEATTPDGGTGGFEVSNTCNTHIQVSNMYINFNSVQAITNADHKTGLNGKWVWGLQFAGVVGLQLSNLYLYDPASFAVGITNSDTATVDNVGMWARNNSGAYGTNTDWIHTNGPAKNVDIRNSTVDQGGDDACAANEWDGWSPGATIPGDLAAQPNVAFQQGPIDNYRCHHNRFVSVVAGMRVLNSGGGRAGKNISFDNIAGTATQQVAEVSAYFNTGACNIADVTFTDINMVGGVGNGNYVFNGCTGGVYRLAKINIPPASTTAKQFVYGSSNINQILLSDVTIANLTGAQLTGSWIGLTGTISQMNASINWLTRSGDTSTLFGGTGPTNLVATVTGNSSNFEGWGTKPTVETILSPAISLLEGNLSLLPQMKMFDTAAGTNGGRWDIIPLGSAGANSTLTFRALNDAGLSATNWLSVSRSAQTPTLAAFSETTTAPQMGTTGAAPNFSTSGAVVASATTIAITSPIFHISGTAAIATMTFPAGFDATHGGCVDVIADGAWQTTTAGNFFAVMTAVPGTPYRFCVTNTADKWFGK